MPVYEYRCPACQRRIEQMRSVAARNQPLMCPQDRSGDHCGAQMARIPSITSSYIGSTDRPTRGQS